MGVPLAIATVEFATETFADVLAEAAPLLHLHWEEIAKNKSILTLNPDVEMYLNLGDKLLLVTARYERVLIGYFLWIVLPHPHYKHVLGAEEDLHFLLPEFRRGITGYNLLRAARDRAIAHGARFLVMREKIGHEHVPLMRRLGFTPTDIVYTSLVKE